MHQIRHSFTPKITKSVKDQFFEHKIWRPACNKDKEKPSNQVSSWFLNTSSAVRKAALHQTIQEHRLDLLALAKTCRTHLRPISWIFLRKGLLPLISGEAAMMTGGGVAFIHKNHINTELIQYTR